MHMHICTCIYAYIHTENDALIALLRAEIEELRKEQEAAWQYNPEMAKLVKDNMKLQRDIQVDKYVCVSVCVRVCVCVCVRAFR